MVRLPNGQPLVAAEDIDIEPGGDSVLVTGPSGAGKSTLFRVDRGDLAVRQRRHRACRRARG